MDWLHTYTTIHHQKRVVRFQLPNELELKWEGRGSNQTRNVLFDLKANKILSKGLGADENRSYEEVYIEILDRQVKRLRRKEVSTIKVLWRNHLVEGATWEAEADMASRYPHLFIS